uniref:Uncharacterized protein n=1 Tax=Arundo donax TaxID=35708 RepID=A0A0A9AKQ7_ARUDO
MMCTKQFYWSTISPAVLHCILPPSPPTHTLKCRTTRLL